MANNRMALRCKKCGSTKTIAKYYPVEWSARLEDFGIDAWFDIHDEHSKTDFNGDLSMGGQFYDLVYEVEMKKFDTRKDVI
ncbi:hypothetical protein F6X56_14925 [Rhodococcus erythropolis]|uniref:hypothetical protein n=1 Tax=Rhodococcus erythropolis group TaxID=2840174 RepID=UPI0012481FBF|nr:MULTISPECIES: hypothetical protein [Rhodococcus erythropolis group]MBW4814609.1 hypothetical protein [Rhodococcus qingshengii]QEX10914.1 hypothetical protein F6X56_14925 [Rhodococcus erythropolis]